MKIADSSPRDVVAIVPVRSADLERDGVAIELAGRPLVAYTIEAARASSLIGRVVAYPDGDEQARLCRHFGADVPFLRPPELSRHGVGLDAVLVDCLVRLSADRSFAAKVVVVLEPAHPVRPAGLVDRVVQTLAEGDFDTVFTAYEERHSFWRVDAYGELQPLEQDLGLPRGERAALYKEMSGLVLACRTQALAAGSRFGTRVGLVPVRESYGLVDVQDPGGLALAECLLGMRRAEVSP